VAKPKGLIYQGLSSQCVFVSSWDLFWSHQTVELLPSVMWPSQSTPAHCMFAHFARPSPCAKTQSVTLTHFFMVQTVTISVSTAGDFSLDLGFFCFIWGSGVIIENLGVV